MLSKFLSTKMNFYLKIGVIIRKKGEGKINREFVRFLTTFSK